MIHRARAPLRLGLAGGGTDVSPYSDLYGGAILNATISLFASANIQPTQDGKIHFHAVDLDEDMTFPAEAELPTDHGLGLLAGIYNRVVRDYHRAPLSFQLTTFVDAPKGSGLGSSSTITVAVLGAFAEWLKLPLGEYDLARLAYEIERIDLGMAGGKQDQYAATFGGFNYMEFYGDDKVIVNPLRLKPDAVAELESNLILYYTGTSRLSARIIQQQSQNFGAQKEKSLEAAHKLKAQAIGMKEALLLGDFLKIGEWLDFGWQNKKKTAANISNPVIDEIYQAVRKAGATGGKISGAGGGGFMIFYVPFQHRQAVVEKLKGFGGEVFPFIFTNQGMTSWTVS